MTLSQRDAFAVPVSVREIGVGFLDIVHAGEEPRSAEEASDFRLQGIVPELRAALAGED